MKIENFSSNVIINNKLDNGEVKQKGKEVAINEKLLDSREKEISEDVIIKSIEKANEKLILADRKLEFSIHEKTKQIIVKVINTKNDEVVREVPSEKILDMVANMIQNAGLLVDERA